MNIVQARIGAIADDRVMCTAANERDRYALRIDLEVVDVNKCRWCPISSASPSIENIIVDFSREISNRSGEYGEHRAVERLVVNHVTFRRS